MQKVFNNSMVAHVWAQQNQDQGRNSNDSFYFYGSTIFSYNSTFPIAKFVKSDVVLFTTKKYSTTTAKHCNDTLRAIPHGVQVFDVPNVEIKAGTKHEYSKEQNKKFHSENVADYKKRINDLVLQAARSRKYNDELSDQAVNLCDELNQYIDCFKLRFKYYELPNSDELKAKADRKRKAELKKEKARKAQILKDNQEKIDRWLSGESVSLPYGLDVLLRVVDDEIQTSQNAKFPVEHAKLALKFIDRCKRNKTVFTAQEKTIRLGYFSIDRIDEKGNVRAGCHFVKNQAIERIKDQVLNFNS